MDSTTIGEIRIIDRSRGTIYSNFPPGGEGRSLADTPHFEDLGALLDGLEPVAEHPTAPRASDGTVYKYVTRASQDSSRLIQVGVPIESSAGNLLYSVYQQQADILVRSRNLQALWIVNLETLVSERTRELQQSNQQLRIAHEAMEEELATAKVVQHALVREGGAELGPFSAYVRMPPAKHVGGDFVDVVGPSDGTLFFVIGDVSGKGVAAALFMAAFQSAVKSAFLGRAEIAEDTNRRLCSQNPMGMFVTCMLAMVNLENGAVDYVCAGHEPAFLIGNDDSRRVLPLTGGLAMGLMEDFDYSSGHEVLQPGETLFMYTDGLTDATDRNGELFGKERLEGTLHGSSRQSPEHIVDNIWNRIGDFSAGTAADDDMTYLVLRRR